MRQDEELNNVVVLLEAICCFNYFHITACFGHHTDKSLTDFTVYVYVTLHVTTQLSISLLPQFVLNNQIENQLQFAVAFTQSKSEWCRFNKCVVKSESEIWRSWKHGCMTFHTAKLYLSFPSLRLWRWLSWPNSSLSYILKMLSLRLLTNCPLSSPPPQFLDVFLDVYLSFYPLISKLVVGTHCEMQELQKGGFLSWYLLANCMLISALQFQHVPIITTSLFTKLPGIIWVL